MYSTGIPTGRPRSARDLLESALDSVVMGRFILFGAILLAVLLHSQPAGTGAIRFEASRLQFVTANSPTPNKNQVETMVAGVALLDYDGDGRLDIYLVNGARIPTLGKDSPAYWNRLFRNEGRRNLHRRYGKGRSGGKRDTGWEPRPAITITTGGPTCSSRT